jgi:hypothetical protein
VIETVIRHMEAGMERWGVPVPRADEEEMTELALSFDDAEFQHDPDAANAANAADAADAADAANAADGADGADAADGAGGSNGAGASNGPAESEAHLHA